MKALVKLRREPDAMEIMDVPVPAVREEEALVRVKAVGVCATDLKIFRNAFPCDPPVIMGHEFSGVIERTGAGVTDYAPGCRVVSEQHFGACGRCRFCLTGQRQLCISKKSPGYHSDGAFAEFIPVNQSLLHRIPEGISYPEACLLEPMAVITQALYDRSALRPEDTVAILGAGLRSLMAVQILKAQGAAKIFVIGSDSDEPVRFPLANSFGARTVNAQRRDPVSAVSEETDGYGADAVIDLDGSERSIQLGFAMLRRRGSFFAISMPDKEIAVPWKDLVVKAPDIRFSFSSGYAAWERSLSMLRRGVVDLKPFTKNLYPLGDWRRAFSDTQAGIILNAILLPDLSAD